MSALHSGRDRAHYIRAAGVALMDIRFAILGQTALRVGGRLGVQWGPPKLRALLAALLVRPGALVSADELADWIWAEGEHPDNPPQALYLYVSRIRRTLKEFGDDIDIFVDNRNFRLAADPLTIDYFQFQDQIRLGRAHARRGDSQRALDTIGAAFRLWRQRPLTDAQGDAAELWRQQMRRNVLLPAFDSMFRLQLALGEADAVLAKLDELAVDYRSHLTLFKRRLEALHAQSRWDEATEEFLAVHRQLSADFDDIGARDLRTFHERLKEHGPVQVAAPSTGTAVVPVPNQLPPPVPVLVGHDALLAKLDAVTDRPGLVVVDGAGGLGKTALVVYWAHTALDRFPDGVLYLDLHGFSDGPVIEPAAAVDRFLEAFGVSADRIANPQQRAAKLQSLLNGRRVLVVLDNARETSHVQPLLPLLSPAVVIVTSRSRLSGLAVRQVPYCFPIVPLDVEQSTRLLSAHIGFRAETSPEAVAHMARLCQGWPITLKILAQYIAARPNVPLSSFAEQLGRDIRLLDIGTVGDGADHGLRAVFAQSVRALDQDTHRLFRTLGTHPGPDFGVGVAAALSDMSTRRTRLALDALVEANLLVQADTLGRYTFHDVVREYAAELVASPAERQAAETSALNFYTYTAENADRIVFPTQARVHTLSTDNRKNALEFTDAESARKWCVEERHNLTAIIRSSAGAPQAAQLPHLAGQILLLQGHTEEVLTILRSGLSAAGTDIQEQANTLHNIALIHLIRQDFAAAEHHVHLAHLKFAEIGDETGIAGCLHTNARIRVETGDIPMGIDSHERALRTVRRAGEKGMEAVFLYRAGEAYQRATEFERAAAYYRESLTLARALADSTIQGRVLTMLGSLSFAREQTAEARRYLSAGLVLLEHAYDIGFAGTNCGLLAQVELESGRLFEATQYGRQALRLCRRVFDPRGEADALHTLGRIFRKTARREAAIEAWEQAEAIYIDLDPERARQTARSLSELTTLTVELPSVRQTSPISPGTRTAHLQ